VKQENQKGDIFMEKTNLGISRRQFGGVVVGAAALAGGTAVTSAAAESQDSPKTFVLVHGAWHGGWCWRMVADQLEAQGHKVFTPTLTGLGERSHLLTPETDLALHVQDVVNVIEWEGLEDFVLVGHSYGGMVISGVADQLNDKISAIVYVDAFFPSEGDSVASLSDQATNDAITGSVAGDLTAWPAPDTAYFAIAEENVDWIVSKMTPQPLQTFVQASAPTAGRENIASKTYIRALQFSSYAFDTSLAALEERDDWATMTMDVGHDIMTDQPDELTQILLSA
jgi:pimeloyl-ACP methyl ester carboxylesterase